jgi:hypothetical protein
VLVVICVSISLALLHARLIGSIDGAAQVLHDEVIAVRDDNYFPSPTDPSHSSGGGGMSPNGAGSNNAAANGTGRAVYVVLLCAWVAVLCCASR